MRYQTAPFRPDPRSETIELLFYRALKHLYKHPYEAVRAQRIGPGDVVVIRNEGPVGGPGGSRMSSRLHDQLLD